MDIRPAASSCCAAWIRSRWRAPKSSFTRSKAAPASYSAICVARLQVPGGGIQSPACHVRAAVKGFERRIIGGPPADCREPLHWRALRDLLQTPPAPERAACGNDLDRPLIAVRALALRLEDEAPKPFA